MKNRNFKFLTSDEEKCLNKLELIEYYKNMKEFYKNSQKLSVKIRKIIHPFVLAAMESKVNFKLEIINPMPIYNGPAIFAVNHSNCHDAPVASSVIKKHHYVLVGKQNLKFIDKIAFQLNGVIYVDRKDKKSRNDIKQEMIVHLLRGGNILMFPEGTWNLSPNKIMLPLNWGVVDIAKKTNVPVIPIVMEYKGDCCYINCAQPIFFDFDQSNEQSIEILKEKMASLKWQIWNKFPVEKRENVSLEQFEREIQKLIDEYPKLNIEYEKSVIRQEYPTYDEVFEPIKKLQLKKI